MMSTATSHLSSLAGLVVFERYRLVAPLEAEARGEAYVAEPLRDHGEVVVRFLSHPAFARAARATWGAISERFEALCAIEHPHLERVLTGGIVHARDEDLLCVVAERTQGTTLHSWLRTEGRLGPHDALCLAHRMALGLEAVHVGGVMHGDLRAGNVLLARTAPDAPTPHWPVLKDIGVTNLLAAALGTEFSTHELAWTPDAAAPEQIRGEPVTAGTDVYAFGLILYRMLTGASAFVSETASELLVAQLSMPPVPLSERCPEAFAPELEALVMRCLEKRPEDRFANGTALVDALVPLLPDAARGIPHRRTRPSLPVDADRSSQRAALRDSALRRVSQAEVSARRLRAPTLQSPRFGATQSSEFRRASQPPAATVAIPELAVAPTPVALNVEALLRPLLPYAVATLLLTFVVGGLTGYALSSLTHPKVATGTLALRNATPPVRVRVRSNVSGAHVLLRGHHHPLPLEMMLTPSSVDEMVEVSAPGYEARRMWMPFDQPVDAQVDLAATVAAMPSPATPVARDELRRARRRDRDRTRSQRLRRSAR